MPADGRARGPMGGQRGGAGAAGQPMGAVRGRGLAARLLLMEWGARGRARGGAARGRVGGMGVFGPRRCPLHKGSPWLPGGLGPGYEGARGLGGPRGGRRSRGNKGQRCPHGPDGTGGPQSGLLMGLEPVPAPSIPLTPPAGGLGHFSPVAALHALLLVQKRGPSLGLGSGCRDVQGNPPVWGHCESHQVVQSLPEVMGCFCRASLNFGGVGGWCCGEPTRGSQLTGISLLCLF